MSKEFEAIEQNAVDAPVNDIKWYGKEDQTEESSIHDTSKGEPVVIRVFTFKSPPNTELTKEEILTPQMLKFLDGQLWGDALRRVSEPRIVFEENGFYKIGVSAVAATGQSFLEEPKYLQEYL